MRRTNWRWKIEMPPLRKMMESDNVHWSIWEQYVSYNFLFDSSAKGEVCVFL